MPSVLYESVQYATDQIISFVFPCSIFIYTHNLAILFAHFLEPLSMQFVSVIALYAMHAKNCPGNIESYNNNMHFLCFSVIGFLHLQLLQIVRAG